MRSSITAEERDAPPPRCRWGSHPETTQRVRALAVLCAGRAYHSGHGDPGRFQPAMGLRFREAVARCSRGWGGSGIQGELDQERELLMNLIIKPGSHDSGWVRVVRVSFHAL